MTSEYFLKCNIDPQKGHIKVEGTIIISSIEKNMFFVLNRGLRWTKTIRKTASGDQVVEPHRSNELEVPRFYNGELWTFDIVDSLQDEFVIEVKYSGQIHPPVKESGMPQMGYIRRDFIELACYSAWYPVPMNIETNMSFEISIEGPNDWTWMVNATQKQVNKKNGTSEWRWKQNSFVNDIVILGLPQRNLYQIERSHFWGPKDVVANQKVLDDEVYKMEQLLVNWLGQRETDTSIKFVITPRAEGGAYARSGIIVVGGGYSTDISLRRQVLQSMCHEICHDWFCKASVKTYDNWIDEALAEYCSVIITENHLNNDFLEWRIKTTEEKLEKQGPIPSIRSLTRDNELSYTAFYFRGFLLLEKLSNVFGKQQFHEVIREFAEYSVKNKSVTTDIFLDLLVKKFGNKALEITNEWLNYEGVGIPRE